MNNRLKRIMAIVSLIVVLAFIIGMMIEPLIWSKADSVSDLQGKYDNLQSQKNQIQQQINQNKSQQADANSQIKGIQQKIDTVNAILGNLNGQMDQLNAQISKKQSEISAKQADIQKTQSLYSRRLRILYEMGDISYIEVLLSSRNFTDFFDRTQTLSVVTKYTTSLLEKLKSDKRSVESDQKQILQKKSDLQKLQAEARSNQADLRNQYSDMNDQLAKLKNDSGSFASQLSSVEKQIEQTDGQIEEEARKAKAGSYVGGEMYWPIQDAESSITSNFYWRYDPYYKVYSFHPGLDIIKADHNSYGWPVHAANSGTVIAAVHSGSGYGNHIEIDHGGGVVTLYGHMSSFASGISEGTAVTRGQVIGYIGSTGASTGPHLHFSVLVDGTYVNPLNYSYGNPDCSNLSAFLKANFANYCSVKP